MSRPATFNQYTPEIEAKFIALTKIFFAKRKEQRRQSVSGIVRFFELFAAAIDLFMFELRLYRVIAAYNALLIKFPPFDSAEAQKRMETLSFVIRNVQEIVHALGVDAEMSLERLYLSRVCDVRDGLMNIWDVYSDTTNADLISRIKDVAVHYLPQNETRA
jgi:hypothetical protein